MASGPLATTITDAVRDIDEPWHIVGVDSNPMHIHAANVDERILVPRIKDPNFMPLMRQIISETKPDLFWPLHDDEMPMFVAERNLGAKMFMPALAEFELTQDKMRSIEHYRANGVPAPKTLFINDDQDLKAAFKELDGLVWLRAVRGAGGKGAFKTSDINDARRWLDLNDGWRSFTAAEVIEGPECVVEMLWKDGDLIWTQLRTRPDGNQGEMSRGSRNRRLGLTGAPEAVREVGINAIKSVSQRPNGVYFVDTKVSEAGVPHVTEINAGRFPMNGSPRWRKYGFNSAEAYLKLGLDEPLDFETPLHDPIRANILKLHGIDFPTTFMELSETEQLQEELERRLATLSERAS